MKFFKHLSLLGVVLCLVLGMVAACGQNNDPTEDTGVDYTVTVTCEDAQTLAAVSVKIMNGTQEVAKKALENGTAKFHLEPATYGVELEGVPQNYTYIPASLTAISRTATVALTANSDVKPQTVVYTVTVKLPDGTPVPGVRPQLCGGPVYTCTPSSGPTNDEGLATFPPIVAGEYEVHIESGWPEGYYFDNTEFTIGAEGGNITVYFHKDDGTHTAQPTHVTVSPEAGEVTEDFFGLRG